MLALTAWYGGVDRAGESSRTAACMRVVMMRPQRRKDGLGKLVHNLEKKNKAGPYLIPDIKVGCR